MIRVFDVQYIRMLLERTHGRVNFPYSISGRLLRWLMAYIVNCHVIFADARGWQNEPEVYDSPSVLVSSLFFPSDWRERRSSELLQGTLRKDPLAFFVAFCRHIRHLRRLDTDNDSKLGRVIFEFHLPRCRSRKYSAQALTKEIGWRDWIRIWIRIWRRIWRRIRIRNWSMHV